MTTSSMRTARCETCGTMFNWSWQLLEGSCQDCLDHTERVELDVDEQMEEYHKAAHGYERCRIAEVRAVHGRGRMVRRCTRKHGDHKEHYFGPWIVSSVGGVR